MNVIKYPTAEELPALLRRPVRDAADLNATVSAVLSDVRERGDEAVIDYEERFDHVRLQELAVSEQEMQEAWDGITPQLRQALELAHRNIEAFHSAQRFEPTRVQVTDGIECWQQAVPIERVGLYIPGGTAPLFSTVLMLATPARIAGCGEIVLCTPPQRDGRVHPAVLCAARIDRNRGIQVISQKSLSLFQADDITAIVLIVRNLSSGYIVSHFRIKVSVTETAGIPVRSNAYIKLRLIFNPEEGSETIRRNGNVIHLLIRVEFNQAFRVRINR